MARRKINPFAKRNKGKVAKVLLNNLLTPSSKSKRKSNSSSISAAENVGCSTIFYILLLIISWGLFLLYSFGTLINLGSNMTDEGWALQMQGQLIMTAIPISLHLIKFIFKTIKKGKKMKETKPITEEKDLESGGEISTAETMEKKPVVAEGVICQECNKRTKTNLEKRKYASTFKKNVFSVKGFFLTVFTASLWLQLAILKELYRWPFRYNLNRIRCQCDHEALRIKRIAEEERKSAEEERERAEEESKKAEEERKRAEKRDKLEEKINKEGPFRSNEIRAAIEDFSNTEEAEENFDQIIKTLENWEEERKKKEEEERKKKKKERRRKKK